MLYFIIARHHHGGGKTPCARLWALSRFSDFLPAVFRYQNNFAESSDFLMMMNEGGVFVWTRPLLPGMGGTMLAIALWGPCASDDGQMTP